MIYHLVNAANFFKKHKTIHDLVGYAMLWEFCQKKK